MRTKEFLSKLEHDRIVNAIRDAESKTSGEIRVFIQRGKLNVDPLVAAQKQFHRLRMHNTDHRASVLIFVAPRAHKFAVVGDRAIHEKCGKAFWQQLVDSMREHFRSERFSHALVEAIEEAGKALASHFPKSTSRGDLPNKIVEG
ncbi:MAG TPA: TPM domain-containing protein [Chthoniobacterales bacterium]|nr:TPM domain-containing protein [Chthoniobacterales bacterium]